MVKPLPPRDPRQVSASPTLPASPRPAGGDRPFDVRDLYAGPAEGEAGAASPGAAGETRLDEKLRQAYFWMVNHAIIAPYYDLEFEERTPIRIALAVFPRPGPPTKRHRLRIAKFRSGRRTNDE